MRHLCLILLLICPRMLSAQKPAASRPFTHDELKRVLNNAFNKLVSSNPNPGEVANYASLDPVNASFNVKGTIPVQPGRLKRQKNMTIEEKIQDAPARISYLSFDVSGGLVDKNYGALFSNSSLNAGVSLGAKYNFTLRKPEVKYFIEDWTQFEIKKELLLLRHNNNRVTLESTLNATETVKARRLLEMSKLSNRTRLEKKETEADLVQKTVDSLGSEIIKRPGLSDTLQKLIQEKTALRKSLDIIHFALDSITILNNRASDIKIIELTNARAKLKKDYDALFALIPLQKLKITWFTISGGYTRKSFKTFDASLPFADQIAKNKLNAWNFGFAINHLLQDSLKHRSLFLSLGVVHLRNNNLPFLSTITVEQTRTITNSAGDITRTISSKQTVYTDPVKAFGMLNVTGHAYYMFGKTTTSGVHIQPAVGIQDDDHTVTYLTLGYLTAFQNTVKDQPLINAELYIRFNDVFNDLGAKDKFINRNEIGISFTVPFRFL